MPGDQEPNQTEPTLNERDVDSSGQGENIKRPSLGEMVDSEAASIEREPETGMVSTFDEKPAATVTPPAAVVTPPLETTPVVPAAVPPKKSGKKKWIIAGVVAALVVVVGGGGVFAYTAYQNPEKVLMDGVVNVFGDLPTSGKASLSYKTADSSFDLAVDAKRDDTLATGLLTVKYKADTINLEGSANFAAAVSGDGYIKINDLDKLAKTAIDVMVDEQAKWAKESGFPLSEQEIADMKTKMYDEYKPTIDKINNKWVKFPADKSDKEEGKNQKCLADTMKKLKKDSKMRDELATVYKNNKFIVIKDELGVKNGSYGFSLDFDQKKANAFGRAVEKTAFAKEVEHCIDPDAKDKDSNRDYESDDTDSESESPLKNEKYELWISQWSHQITAINAAADIKDGDKASIKFSLSVDYKAVTGLSVPKDSIDYKEVEESLSKQEEANSTSNVESLITPLMSNPFQSVL